MARFPELEGIIWHGAEDEVEIGTFRLKSPLLYSTFAPRSEEPSAIIRDKRLQAPADGLPPLHQDNQSFYRFFNGYVALNMREAWMYLEWLSYGRPTPAPESFMLLYLKGLERRVVVDAQDFDLVWNETWRFLTSADPYQSNSFNFYANQLLWFLVAKAPDVATVEQVQSLAQRLMPLNYWNPDSHVKLSLLVWWSIRHYGYLPVWMATECARVSLLTRQTVVEERVSEEMRELMGIRLRGQFGDQLPGLLPPKARQRMRYRAHNPSIPLVSVTWPDPLQMHSTWGRLQHDLASIYEDCQQELRPLALLLGKEGITRESAVAWEQTPPLLRRSEHPSRRKVETLVGAALHETGLAVTVAGDIAKMFDVAEKESISPSVGKKLAASLQSCGFGIEPDPRLTERSLKWTDRVALFNWQNGATLAGELTPDPQYLEIEFYQQRAFVLKLVLYVAQAAGALEDATLHLILTRIRQIMDWDDLQQIRYSALAQTAKSQPLDAAALRSPYLDEKFDKDEIKRFLFEMVAGSGRINAAQEKALGLVLKRLGFDSKSVKSEMDTLSSKGVIFIGSTIAVGGGERIPPPPDETVPFELNRSALQALLDDTHKIQATLNEAMTEAEEVGTPEPEPTPIIEIPPAIEEEFSGLMPRFVPFLRALLKQEEWEESDAQQLAREHKVMLSGAVEAINDWAFEALGTQLIWEDGANLSIDRALLK